LRGPSRPPLEQDLAARTAAFIAAATARSSLSVVTNANRLRRCILRHWPPSGRHTLRRRCSRYRGRNYRDPRQSDPTGTAELWDDAYANGDSTRRWLQAPPDASLRTLSAAQITVNDSVIDIGGGASRHADALLD
jgi:hypothetical protein